jgi:hypothetical protein
MPNWCSNALIVKGPKKDLDAFKATLNTVGASGEKELFCFHQTVPQPADIIKGNVAFGETRPNWYTWNSANWGTKWSACEARVVESAKSVKIWFDTAWAPPLAWLKSFGEKFPTLTVEMAYCECGMAFYGVAEVVKGEFSDDGGQSFADNDTDEDGEAQGDLAKHLNKYGLGMGG